MRCDVVQSKKSRAALHAIGRVFVKARTMAFEREPHEKIAGLLDDAEELPMLLARDDDMTAAFRSALEGLAAKFPELDAALQDFESDESMLSKLNALNPSDDDCDVVGGRSVAP